METNEYLEKQRYERAEKRVKALAGFYRHFAVFVIINAVVLAVNYFTLKPNEQFLRFNTFSMAFFWGIGIFFHALGTLVPNLFFGIQWEERKITEILSKQKSAKWK